MRRLLNAAARVVLGPPVELPPVHRQTDEAFADALNRLSQNPLPAPETKMRTLHPGREGVERLVAALPRRKRRDKALLPGEAVF